MGGAFSYASFSRANGRAGGWGVGQKAGDITQEELAELVSFVPTSLNNGTTIPDFPSAQQRAELVRRTAVFALTPEAEKWVTMVSVPAGLDATGRGGNVFTYTSISRTGTPPAPATVLFSPDVPAPFSIYEVDKVQIPEEISARGPLHSDVLLEEFLDGEFRHPDKLPAPFKAVSPNPNPTFNRALVSAMAKVLNSRNGLVILVAPDNQAALWIAATAREVGEDGFGFSTFEKAAAINEFPLSTSTMLVVPPSEKQRLAETAIPGNPVVFALDEALPDVSAYEARAAEEAEAVAPEPQEEQAELGAAASSTLEQATTPSFDDSWGKDPADFGAPVADSSPFALSGHGSAAIPTNPLDAPEPSTSQENPFAQAGASSVDSEIAQNPADSSANPQEVQNTDGRDVASNARPVSNGGNAFVPSLSGDEYQNLVHFNAYWWIQHLGTNVGRSIQLAYLDMRDLSGGLDKRLMAAVVASWAFYFPPYFNLLAFDALRRWSGSDLEHIVNLTVDLFSGVFPLQKSERHAQGLAAEVLNDVVVKMAQRENGFRNQALQQNSHFSNSREQGAEAFGLMGFKFPGNTQRR
ncbi:GAP1-N2 domain-containing protein [Corynebacterium sp. Marseille-Q2823]|uniref:GAP1-N2 domain-containing protein n=1 Tax=Corynebacterium sp. Marseille-Q2823 TaxID=2736606 RepID=UPI0020CA8FB7|nr:hypothetical protein [Corynebacterium sp. Marseille-Q2823]